MKTSGYSPSIHQNFMQTTENKGFTLIELSIVLVIIGLIVGGVLVGQDLISAAQVRAQMSQIEKANTAANTFRIKYNGLPGDLTNASTFRFDRDSGPRAGVSDRLGDGQIKAVQNEQCTETFWFWGDLSSANLLEGKTIEDLDSAGNLCLSNEPWVSDGTYVPEGRLGGSVMVYSDNGLNYFYLGAPEDVDDDGFVTEAPVLKNIDAYNIDQKLDDGVPSTGRVQAMADQENQVADGTCRRNADEYDIAGDRATAIECQLRFRAQF